MKLWTQLVSYRTVRLLASISTAPELCLRPCSTLQDALWTWTDLLTSLSMDNPRDNHTSHIKQSLVPKLVLELGHQSADSTYSPSSSHRPPTNLSPCTLSRPQSWGKRVAEVWGRDYDNFEIMSLTSGWHGLAWGFPWRKAISAILPSLGSSSIDNINRTLSMVRLCHPEVNDVSQPGECWYFDIHVLKWLRQNWRISWSSL